VNPGPAQPLNLQHEFKGVEGAGAGVSPDPYNSQFAKTDSQAMTNLIKNGGLDLGDLKNPIQHKATI